jgi:mono/diheme cytochrome c family protein
VLATALLAACTGRHEAPALPDTPGARLYVANCGACHQADGSGVPAMQPPLAGTPVTVGDPEELLGWVMYGIRPAVLPAGRYHGLMPLFSYLGNQELADLLTCVRTSFGNHAPPVTASTVAGFRAAHGGR